MVEKILLDNIIGIWILLLYQILKNKRLIERKILSRMRGDIAGAPGLDNEVWPSGHFVRSLLDFIVLDTN